MNVKSLKKHEAAIVEMAAVLTSATRWVITLAPIDRANLDGIIKGLDGFWDYGSALLSVAFALVEIWATAMVMRAFNVAKDKKDRWALGVAWVASLLVLSLAQIPPLYASLVGVPVSGLGGWTVVYVIAVSIAAFVVIAGVSYADKFNSSKTAPVVEQPPKKPKTTEPNTDDKSESGDTPKRKSRTRKPSGYPAFRDKMASMTEDRPTSIKQVEGAFGLRHATAQRYWSLWRKEQSGDRNGHEG